MAITISMILCKEQPELSGQEILEDLTSKWGDLGVSQFKTEGGTITYEIGSTSVVLGNMPKPIPLSDLKGPCSTSVLWPNSEFEVKHHQSHVLVVVNGKLDPVSTATLLTQFTASVMAVVPEAMGVLWNNAVHLVRKSLFVDFAAEVLPEGPPLDIWVDFRIGPNPDGTTSGFTTGLAPLGHMEIEAVNVPETPEGLRERLQGLAHYLLEKGPVVKDGNTIGVDDKEVIKAVYGPSRFGHKKEVIRLKYEKQSPDNPWKAS